MNPHSILDWLQKEARRLEEERLNEALRKKAAAELEIAAIEAQRKAAI